MQVAKRLCHQRPDLRSVYTSQQGEGGQASYWISIDDDLGGGTHADAVQDTLVDLQPAATKKMQEHLLSVWRLVGIAKSPDL